jgi:aspartyl-tRNA(Asn)/glutamyl-tRNA(Gln) amidotransferase subunit B
MITFMYEPVIGLEIHAELQTQTKMFCSCRVVDSTQAEPNVAVCPVCAGMPGVLPVTNQRAVEFGIMVALALGCKINPRSIFARKNYFYPDLPKGYQISQYEEPLARNGKLLIQTSGGPREIRVRRVHLEEDTGKLTHVEDASLIDLNRAGVPLLEIVSEPDIRSAEGARAYAEAIRSILKYLGVNSGNMQKGVMRIEPNVSIRPIGTQRFGTRTEIKNLNSFRALERGIAYEIERQTKTLEAGKQVRQETVGWNEARQVTFTQRVKEGEEDYRYFPEPDLPPLEIDPNWVEKIQSTLPELPINKFERFQEQYNLTPYDTGVLVADRDIADFFEKVVDCTSTVQPKTVANWITGDIFSHLKESGEVIDNLKLTPKALGALLSLISEEVINNTTGKTVLSLMLKTGKSAEEVVESRGLRQISNQDQIAGMVEAVLKDNPDEVVAYLGGKDGLSNWFFGHVMRSAKGKTNPQIVRAELTRQLRILKENDQNKT